MCLCEGKSKDAGWLGVGDSLVPADDFIEEGLEHAGLVGDSVLANVQPLLL